MSQESSTRPTDALSGLRIDRKPALQQRSAERSFSWGKFFLVLLLLAASGTGLAIYQGWIDLSKLRRFLPDALQNRPNVRVVKATVERGRAAEATVTATGYLESRRQARIGARAVGRVQAVYVEEGSRVKKDDVLAVLEHADLDASLAATQASLTRSKAAIDEQRVLIEQNRREYDRARDLLATRSISSTEHDKARFDFESAEARLKSMLADVELAEARLREAQQLKANMFIRAPFDGTVISKDAEVGESIMPGGMGEASGRGSAVTIADLDNLEAECDVKEENISRVFVDQQAEISVDAVGSKHRYRGVVRKIIPMGDRARATIKVKVSLVDADDRLFPNMSSTVFFLTDKKDEAPTDNNPRTFVPDDSVVHDDKGDYIWVADEVDHAQRVNVKIGETRDGRTEILRGLSGNERIIVNPPELSENQAVKVNQ